MHYVYSALINNYNIMLQSYRSMESAFWMLILICIILASICRLSQDLLIITYFAFVLKDKGMSWSRNSVKILNSLTLKVYTKKLSNQEFYALVHDCMHEYHNIHSSIALHEAFQIINICMQNMPPIKNQMILPWSSALWRFPLRVQGTYWRHWIYLM